MAQKQRFYQRHGVQEMYFYDPQSLIFWVFTHLNNQWSVVTELNLPWVSPLLKIRFEMFEDGLEVSYPNGEPFKTLAQFAQERDRLQVQHDDLQVKNDRLQEQRDRLVEKL